MPSYDYHCAECGPFTEQRPMAEASMPRPCPVCSAPTERAFLSMPNVAGMDTGRRMAFAVNEASVHEPKRSGALAHGPGCFCCSTGRKRSSAVYTADGAKTFPSKRPWMISH